MHPGDRPTLTVTANARDAAGGDIPTALPFYWKFRKRQICRMARRQGTLCAAALAVVLLMQGAFGGYSEFGQDDWVLGLFPDKKGYYVDTGASLRRNSWH